MEELENKPNVEQESNPRKIGGLSIAALVIGFVAMLFSALIIPGILLGITSIVLAIIALKKKEQQVMPIVGISLSAVGIIISLLMALILGGTFALISKNIENGNIQTTYTQDVISGNSWKEDSGSYLVLEKNGKFKYYQDEEDLTDNYYEGTYKVYCGEKAVKYIAEDLKKYGVTEKEQRDIFERNEKYSVDNYYCLVLNNEQCIMNGENVMSKATTTPYFGYYYKEQKILDIANMNTGTYYCFELER